MITDTIQSISSLTYYMISITEPHEYVVPLREEEKKGQCVIYMQKCLNFMPLKEREDCFTYLVAEMVTVSDQTGRWD